MNKQFIKDSLVWGFVLWLIGYILSFVLFFLVPPMVIGWVIAPIGTTITLLVLFKKIKSKDFGYYLKLGISWLTLAVLLDYLFIVKMLNPVDYYKPAVYLYYGLTLVLPILVCKIKSKKNTII